MNLNQLCVLISSVLLSVKHPSIKEKVICWLQQYKLYPSKPFSNFKMFGEMLTIYGAPFSRHLPPPPLLLRQSFDYIIIQDYVKKNIRLQSKGEYNK